MRGNSESSVPGSAGTQKDSGNNQRTTPPNPSVSDQDNPQKLFQRPVGEISPSPNPSVPDPSNTQKLFGRPRVSNKNVPSDGDSSNCVPPSTPSASDEPKNEDPPSPKQCFGHNANKDTKTNLPNANETAQTSHEQETRCMFGHAQGSSADSVPSPGQRQSDTISEGNKSSPSEHFGRQ